MSYNGFQKVTQKIYCETIIQMYQIPLPIYPIGRRRRGQGKTLLPHFAVILQIGEERGEENWIHTLNFRGGCLLCARDTFLILQASNTCLLVESVVRTIRNGKVVKQAMYLDWSVLNHRQVLRVLPSRMPSLILTPFEFSASMSVPDLESQTPHLFPHSPNPIAKRGTSLTREGNTALIPTASQSLLDLQ